MLQITSSEGMILVLCFYVHFRFTVCFEGSRLLKVTMPIVDINELSCYVYTIIVIVPLRLAALIFQGSAAARNDRSAGTFLCGILWPS